MNGLDIAYLNGIGGDDRASAIKRYATNGYNDQIENEITLLTEGHDFSGVDASDQIASDEAIHSHLVRLYGIVDKCPQLISGYQDPKNFKRMLGYVLNNWDSSNREQAIEDMAREEERLIGIGAIQNDWEELDKEAYYLAGEDAYDPDTMELMPLGAVRIKKEKRGLFNQLKKIANPKLTERAAKIVATNPAMKKIKDRIREALAKSRKTVAKVVRSNAGKPIKMLQKKAVVNKVNGLGLLGDDDVRSLLMGDDLELFGTTSNPEVDGNALRNYMLRTHKVITEHPNQLFENSDEEEVALNALGAVLGAANTVENFQASIDKMLRESGLKGLGSIGASLTGFLGATNSALDAKGQKKVDEAKKKYNDLKAKADAAEKKAKDAEAAYAKIQSSSDKKAVKNAKKAAEKARKEANNALKKADKAYSNIAKTEKSEANWTKARASLKKIGEKIVTVFKKIWKVIVRFNPICLLMRGGLLLALRLNMFKFAAKLYPGSLSESDAMKLGFTKDQYQKMKQGYEKSLSFYTKVGGKKETFDKVLVKGAKKTWGGSEVYSKEALKSAVSNNIDALKKDITAQEQKMKKEGVQFVSDPNVTYEKKKVEEKVPVSGLGAALCAVDELLENRGELAGLGALGEPITIATVTATAGGTLAAIGTLLSKLGIKGDWFKKVADGVKKVVEKGKEIVQKVKDKVQTAKTKYNDIKSSVKDVVSNFKSNVTQAKDLYNQAKSEVQKAGSQIKSAAQKIKGQVSTASSSSNYSSTSAAKKPAKSTAKSSAAARASVKSSAGAKTPAKMVAKQSAALQAQQQASAQGSNTKKYIAAGGIVLALAAVGAYMYNNQQNA
jgi:hypothetical protein